MIGGLIFSGFDVLSVANNHIFDWGADAFLDTISLLRSAGITPVGGGADTNEARRPAIVNRGGMRACFLAYSEFAGSSDGAEPKVAGLNHKEMLDDISKMKDECSLVVVSIHWGEEYETSASESQRSRALAMVDAGAKLVVGHHPHVIQEVEMYKGSLIAYSLGNFVFDQNFSEETGKSLMLEVTIKGSDISEFRRTTVKFNNEFQPYFEGEV